MEIPRSEISDTIVETVAPRLSNVTFLDISSCTKIGARALEAFGKHCKSLVGLRRVMHPIDLVDKVCQHDEAHAIACSMPKLRHLEMGYMLIATEAVLEILGQCRDLKFLDLRGCWTVDDKLLRERHPGLHDQDVLNAIKCDPYVAELGVRIRFLSTELFGGLCEPSRNMSRVCTMHANCCIGLRRKISDLNAMLQDWRRFRALPREDKHSVSWTVPRNCR